MTRDIVLSMCQVSKRYPTPAGEVKALCDISFDLAAGEFGAVVGPSGSGKTTLLHIAALIEPPSRGCVRFEGELLSDLSERDRARRRAEWIGLIFQRFHLMPHWSVLENVRLRFRYTQRSATEAEALSRAALEHVGLSTRTHHPARLLSGGEMQRVAIARAIALPPRLLAADEPTGNLDRASAAQVIECLRALCDRGVAVLLATHNETLLRTGDIVLQLRDGRAVAVGRW